MKNLHRMMRAVCSVVLILLLPLPLFARVAPVVRVGYEQNHPMAGTAENGKAQGIMIDIVEEIARTRVGPSSMPPASGVNALKTYSMPRSTCWWDRLHPGKGSEIQLQSHTVISNWGLLYSRPGQRIESYADLNGKRIAVVKNDVLLQHLHQDVAAVQYPL